MNFKKTVFLILGCVSSITVFALTADMDIPNNTRLIDQKSNLSGDKSVLEESEFIYDSQLAKKNIIGFYQRYLNQLGFQETLSNTGDRYKKNVFMFQKQTEQKYVKLIFLEEWPGVTKYKLDVMQFKTAVRDKSESCKAGNCGPAADAELEKYPFYQSNDGVPASLYFVEPKKVDFMPMLSGVKQVEYIEWKDAESPMITIGYLSREDAFAVIDFYSQKMLSYGWDLTDNQPHQGVYSTKEWVGFVAPYTSLRDNYTKIFPEQIPLLKIHGATLTFTNSSQKCIITVNTFDDVLQLATQQTFYDVKFLKDYGTTVVGIIYFYEGA